MNLVVPIETDFSLVLLQATIGGSPPLWFLLDTGADACVLDAGLAADLGLPMGDATVLPQPGGDVVTAAVGMTTVSVAGRPVWTVPMVAAPIARFASFPGRPLHGILGHQAVAQHVIDLDYRSRTMTIGGPSVVESGVPLDIGPTPVDDVAALVTATIGTVDGRSVEGRFKLDTGASGTLGLSANFARDAGLPAAGQPTLLEQGIGAGGVTEARYFRIASLRLGDHLLSDLPINVTTFNAGLEESPYAGTLAGEILCRFRVVLDYANDRMGLSPYPTVWDRFPFDGAGLTTAYPPGGATMEVTEVYPDSPAAAAGLRPGDHIGAIDGRPIVEVGQAGAWHLFRGGVPSTHRLLVQRDGHAETVELVLSERI